MTATMQRLHAWKWLHPKVTAVGFLPRSKKGLNRRTECSWQCFSSFIFCYDFRFFFWLMSFASNMKRYPFGVFLYTSGAPCYDSSTGSSGFWTSGLRIRCYGSLGKNLLHFAGLMRIFIRRMRQ
jgi:hypothetical protein